MAENMWIKIDGCKGEATDDKHKDEIDVDSYSWGMSHPVDPGGTGQSAGESTATQLVVSKTVDKATPNLMKFCMNAKSFPTVVLTCRKRGENPIEYMKITMKNAIVASVQDSGSRRRRRRLRRASPSPSRRSRWSTPRRRKTARPTASVKVTWDFAKNTGVEARGAPPGGEPEAALSALQAAVRAEPANPKLRVFLFQLLCMLGDWERARAQLKALGELDAGSLPLVHLYGAAITCELLRREVFAGGRTPVMLGEPLPWVALLLQALAAEAQGRARRGQGAAGGRTRAGAARCPAPSTARPSSGSRTPTRASGPSARR